MSTIAARREPRRSGEPWSDHLIYGCDYLGRDAGLPSAFLAPLPTTISDSAA